MEDKTMEFIKAYVWTLGIILLFSCIADIVMWFLNPEFMVPTIIFGMFMGMMAVVLLVFMWVTRK